MKHYFLSVVGMPGEISFRAHTFEIQNGCYMFFKGEVDGHRELVGSTPVDRTVIKYVIDLSKMTKLIK